MADVLTARQRSFCMSRIRGADTAPEVRLRKSLWALGLKYRLRSRLPGRPDMVLARWRVVVFVDGCFWHQCPRHSVRPKSNAQFWRSKLEGNVARDRRVTAELKKLGWRVIRIWEHDVEKDVVRAARRLHLRITRFER